MRIRERIWFGTASGNSIEANILNNRCWKWCRKTKSDPVQWKGIDKPAGESTIRILSSGYSKMREIRQMVFAHNNQDVRVTYSDIFSSFFPSLNGWMEWKKYIYQDIVAGNIPTQQYLSSLTSQRRDKQLDGIMFALHHQSKQMSKHTGTRYRQDRRNHHSYSPLFIYLCGCAEWTFCFVQLYTIHII